MTQQGQEEVQELHQVVSAIFKIKLLLNNDNNAGSINAIVYQSNIVGITVQYRCGETSIKVLSLAEVQNISADWHAMYT